MVDNEILILKRFLFALLFVQNPISMPISWSELDVYSESRLAVRLSRRTIPRGRATPKPIVSRQGLSLLPIRVPYVSELTRLCEGVMLIFQPIFEPFGFMLKVSGRLA